MPNRPDDAPEKATSKIRVPAPRRPRGCAGVFLGFMLAVAAAWGAGLGLFLHMLDTAERTIERADLYSFRPKEGSKVWSDDGPPRLLHEFATEARQVVPLSEIPLSLQKAFIASEDHIYYQHKGVRPDAIVKGAAYTFQRGRPRGGSTITQQLVRNIDRTGVTTEVTLQRKINEALIAIQLERRFTKDEILELYLNQIYLGAWGVEAASQHYFSKSCRDLSLAEAALLAGINPSPSRLDPFKNPTEATKRRNVVLEQMLRRKFITAEECAAAKRESLDDSLVTAEERRQLPGQVSRAWPSKTSGYFVEEVRRIVGDSSPVTEQVAGVENPVFESGLQIRTTLDTRLQAAAERILLEQLDKFDETKRADLKRRGREADFVPVSGALVCIDNRPGCQGFIRAMVGGRDFERQKFNMATQAKRQPGSGVKPYVWAAAIDLEGMTPSSLMNDRPVTYTRGSVPWSPKNFGGDYFGTVTLRVALQKSLNTVSVQLADRIGVPRLRSYMEKIGVTQPIDPMAGLTLALGSSVVTILDQAACYSVFANGGVRYPPTFIKEIRDRDGLVLQETRPEGVRVMDANVAFVVTHLMRGVCEFGTGIGTKDLARPRAGKTGTTNDSKDVWFNGFTPAFTCIVWIGYEDNSPLGTGRAYTGGAWAVPVWTQFMIEAHKGLTETQAPDLWEFKVPAGVEMIGVDRRSGARGGSFQEAFIEGSGPPVYTPKPATPAPPSTSVPPTSPAPPPIPATPAGIPASEADLLPQL